MKRTYKRPSNKRLEDAVVALRAHKIIAAINLLRYGTVEAPATMKKPAASVPRPRQRAA